MINCVFMWRALCQRLSLPFHGGYLVNHWAFTSWILLFSSYFSHVKLDWLIYEEEAMLKHPISLPTHELFI